MPKIDVKKDNRSRMDLGVSLKMLEQARQNMNLDGTAGYGRCRVDKKGNVYDMNGENIIIHGESLDLTAEKNKTHRHEGENDFNGIEEYKGFVDKKGNVYDMNGENIIDHIDNIKDPKIKQRLMAKMK